MVCYFPLKAYRTPVKNEKTGKNQISFKSTGQSYSDRHLELPCGRCIGCKLERSRQWAIRIMHEASLYEDNIFITLTYDDAMMPANRSLRKRDFQLFMKRLRKKYPSRQIRFFHCGEYGEQFGRPHYHAIIFNFDFDDKKYWSTRHDQPVYKSQKLDDLWSCPRTGKNYGMTEIGTVTFESAAYVARYVTKKLNVSTRSSDDAIRQFDNKYRVINFETGEYVYKTPEYVTMSRRPGIGRAWYDKYKKGVYDTDSVVMRGIRMLPPKAYDRHYEIEENVKMQKIKSQRIKNSKKNVDNNTEERLLVRHEVKMASFNQLKRNLE